MIGRFLLVNLLILILTAAVALAETAASERGHEAYLVLPEKFLIEGFELFRGPYQVEQSGIGADLKEKILILGKFKAPPDWSLVFDEKKLNVQPDGRFEIAYEINEKAVEKNFYAIGPWGDVQQARVGIFYKKWMPPSKAKDAADLSPTLSWEDKKLQVAPGLGLTSLTWRESGFSNFNELALTLKVSGEYRLGEGNFDLGANVFSTVGILSHTTNSYRYFWGSNARVGYRIPKIADPWKFRLSAGIYHTTMFGGTNDFGYENLLGPQMFGTLSRRFMNGQIVAVYLKFATVANGASGFSFNDNEFAFGSSYFLKEPNIGFTIDFSWLSLESKTGLINLNTMTFGLARRV